MKLHHILKAMSVIHVTAIPAMSADHVFMVSVDGLRPAAIEELMETDELPNIARLQKEGVWTHNARTDFDSTSTVPNHVTMITGRPVSGLLGHNYNSNKNPSASDTLHATKGSYVSSVFDVAHDHGLTTAIYRGKSKLSIIDQSYSQETGAVDITGVDNGKGKIDLVRFDDTSDHADQLMSLLVEDLPNQPVNLTLLHLVDPDREGHHSSWDSEGYFDAVRRVDGYLRMLIRAVEENDPYSGRTTIILTSDHGGFGQTHTAAEDPENYVIPFYVWGADVPRGGDLYAINQGVRSDPGNGQPTTDQPEQPIRNGDMGNLALDFLGLPIVPGSVVNAVQDLGTSMVREGTPDLMIRNLPTGKIQIRWAAEESIIVQASSNGVEWVDLGSGPRRSFVASSLSSGKKFYRIRR